MRRQESGTSVRSAIAAAAAVLACATALVAAAPAGAIELYDNGTIVTNANDPLFGHPASRLQDTSKGMSVLGFAAQGSTRIADDFTVGPDPWQVEQAQLLGYDGSFAASFHSVTAEIRTAGPSGPDQLVFGDTSTNRLTDDQMLLLYRYPESNSAAYRQVQQLTVSLGTTLQPGHYWLDWNGSASIGAPFFPPLTVIGQTITGNGMIFPSGGPWEAAMDVGQQGFPFKLLGTPVTPVTTISSPSEGQTLTSGNVPVAFSSNVGSATSQCSVDGASFAACSSPKQLTGLAEGAHTISVRSTRPGGYNGTATVRHFNVAGTPTVTTLAATGVSSDGAVLRAQVNPHGGATDYAFQYGKTTTYGSQTTPASAGAGTTAATKSATIGGLASGTSFHYRAVALRNGAVVAQGADQTFTTRGDCDAAKAALAKAKKRLKKLKKKLKKAKAKGDEDAIRKLKPKVKKAKAVVADARAAAAAACA